jgi:hypothetical protein
MSMLLPPKSEVEFELVPAGSHIAVCYRVIDLGTQKVEYKGQQKIQHKIMLSWELCDEFMTKGKSEGLPFSIHKKYTLSSSDKATLRCDLESWRGRPFSDEDFGKFDIGKLIGVGCLIGVIHNETSGKVYANIKSIMRLPKGMEAKKSLNPNVYFSLNEFDQSIYDSLSENVKATIALSPEYQAIKNPSNHNIDESNDWSDEAIPVSQDIPF